MRPTLGCVITCPHWHQGECDEQNDPGAAEVAWALYRALQQVPKALPIQLKMTHTERRKCDRNRTECAMSVPLARVVLDVHSFRQGAFEGSTIPVVLKPTHVSTELQRVLDRLQPHFTILQGSEENAILERASRQGTMALLLEFPYEKKDKCTFALLPFEDAVRAVVDAVTDHLCQS